MYRDKGFGTTDDTNRSYSFAPIIDECSKVLILGTLPGPESLKMNQYYANPYNQFWRIIYKVFNYEFIDPAYDEKAFFLLKHHIALWDIFHSAERKGALDSDIEFEKPNDIPGLLQAYPVIKKILLAGKKAEKSFRKLFPGISVDAVYVPSTSPAYAKKPFEDKVIDWKNELLQRSE